jgi:VanZ family protein
VGYSDRVNRAAFWAMFMLSIVSAWYPFTLDLPECVRNTAVQLPDGTWDLDGRSRVVARFHESAVAPVTQRRFSITVQARPAIGEQSGPARLLSIGRDPYGPGFMVGVDHQDIVLYLPCHGAASNADAAWRFPIPKAQDIAVTLWFGDGAAGAPSIQVGDGPRVILDNRCQTGSSAGIPDLAQPWALGNVYSGHRPFTGRILKLEMAVGDRRIDLLRDASWQAPEVYWHWPERLYQGPSTVGDELIAASWHFVSFAMVAWFAASYGGRHTVPHQFTAMLAFAAVLTAGKVLVANRHPSVIDLLVNLAGAATGLYAYNRCASPRSRG